MTDLFERPPVEQMAVPSTGAVLPSAPRRQRPERHFAVRRKVIVVVLIVLGVAVCISSYDRLVTALMHDQRQRHLAAEVGAGRAQIHTGQAFGFIQIPSLGVNEIVIEGVNTTTLRSGPAITRASVLPGQQGATVIFGHRSSYGGPFKSAPSLKKGDSIYLQARNHAPVIEYSVDGVHRRSTDASPLPSGAAGISTLVLVTSGSDSLSDDQIIVVATAPATVAGGQTSNPTISLEADGNTSPIGLNLVLVNLASGLAALVWKLARPRGRSMLSYIVVAPVVAVALVWLAQFAESLLPLTR